MRIPCFVLVCSVVLSCAPAPAPTPPPADPSAVAICGDRAFALEDLESRLPTQSVGVASASSERLLTGYREIAQRTCVQQAVLAEIGEPGESDLLLFELLRRQSAVQLFLSEVLLPTVTVTRDEVEEFFEAHGSQLAYQEGRVIRSIFRRYTEHESPDEAVRFLADLRDRVLRGESFEVLAREHSQSETRAVGGHIGFVGRGVLAEDVEAEVFSLAKGEISEPVQVHGGASIFQAVEVFTGRELGLDEARKQIREHLAREKLDTAITDLLDQHPAPEGALILENGELADALQARQLDETLLRVGDLELSLGILIEVSQATGEVGSAPRQPEPNLAEKYRDLARVLVVFEHVETTDFLDDDERRDRLERGTRDAVSSHRAWRHILEMIRARAAARDDDLRSFHEENRERYQTSLRVRLRNLIIEDPVDSEDALGALDAFHTALVRGEMSLEKVSDATAGRLEPARWVDFRTLSRLPGKVMASIIDAGAQGFTPVLRVEGRLLIFEILEREDPRPLGYEQVEERLLDDYIDRHQQQLYREIEDEILERSHFGFFADRVRDAFALQSKG